MFKLFQFKNGECLGCLSPATLKFKTEAEGESVAARYRMQWPHSQFRVLEVNDAGYIVEH